MSPHSVHPNASRERVISAGDSLGHFAAAAPVLERDRLSVWGQNLDESSIDSGTWITRSAAQKNHRIVWLGAVDELRRGIFARFFSCAGEYAIERVIVGRSNRIELVIVTPGARDREAHQSARDDVDAIVDDIVLIIEKPAAECKEASGGCTCFVIDLIGSN